MKIPFSGYDRTEILTNFPVLVTLSTNITNFSYRKFGSPVNGGDLRFTDSTGTNELCYEIETWNTNQSVTVATPTNISGCVLWLSADTGVVTNGDGSVSAWNDSSGNGFNASQGASTSQPVLVKSVLNGRPVVRFDGVNDSLVTTDLSGQFPAAATLFVVTTISNDASYELVYTAAHWDEWWRFNGDSKSYPAVFRTPRIEQYCQMPGSGSHLFSVSSSASTWEMWIDGVTQGASTNGSFSAGGTQTIGSGGSGGPLCGDIAEIIEYNRDLTTDERDRVSMYLAEKYALPHYEPGQSYVWVRVPELGNGSYVYARWGGPDTNPPAYTTNGEVWASSGYLAVWHLGAMSGSNGVDSVGSRNSGFLYNMTDSDWMPGRISGGLNFRDSNDRLEFPDSSSMAVTNMISVEMWIKPLVSSHSAWSTVYGDWYDGNNMAFYIAIYNGVVSLYASSTGANFDYLNGVTVLPLGQWSHIAGTFDTGKLNVYLNGMSNAAEKVSGAVTGIFDSSWRKTLGTKNDAAYSFPFNGVLDEARLSNVARSSNWVWACWMNQESNSTFNGCEPVVQVFFPGTVVLIR